MQGIYYTSFPTPIGKIYIAATQKGLCRISFGQKKEIDFITELRGEKLGIDDFIKEDQHFKTIKDDIIRYLSGKPVFFNKYTIDINGTEFQKMVWRILRDIPYGKVLTYRDVAERIGNNKAFRAVGSACGKNKLAIIVPCHRVIASDGKLGGFSGGLRLKKHLLQLEGIKL